MANFYIGWDVGAWKCTKGKNDSCDAIVLMDENGIIGFHRGNLGDTLHRLIDSPVVGRPSLLIEEWFVKCVREVSHNGWSEGDHYYIAIDTPLGWPRDFKGLLDGSIPLNWTYDSSAANIENNLLYRYTERVKLKCGLSVVVDSIGSQSAKGMYLLQLLGAKLVAWGVWKVGNVTLFETYPKACLVRAGFVEWMAALNLDECLSQDFRVEADKKPKKYHTINVLTDDVFDAAVCACVAKAFATGVPKLVCPSENDSEEWISEGWIFYPDQAETIVDQAIANRHNEATCRQGVTTFHEAITEFQRYVMNKSEKKLKRAMAP
jgi:hypothetical protein